MNVLVATPWLFPAGGGLERYAHTLADELRALGHDVTEIGHGAGRAPTVRLSNAPLSRGFHRDVRALLREKRIDVVHVHTPVPGVAELAAWAARREGVPYAVTYHAGKLTSQLAPLRLAALAHRLTAERVMLDGAAARFAVSPFVAEEIFAPRDCILAPPGVDTARFSPGGAPVPGRVLFVGAVSRAYAWKGFADLFAAVAAVPEASLRVVGGGDLAERYQARARAEGWAERLSFAGRVDDAQLVEEYRAASVVALPSVTPAESFGMALAEGNACGRPAVATRMGGLPFLVRDGENGLLVPPESPRALAVALRRLVGDPPLAQKLGAAGRARMLAEFQWRDVARTVERALATAASARAARRIPS